MVDTCVSGAYEEIRGGSSPPIGNFVFIHQVCAGIEPPMRSISQGSATCEQSAEDTSKAGNRDKGDNIV